MIFHQVLFYPLLFFFISHSAECVDLEKISLGIENYEEVFSVMESEINVFRDANLSVVDLIRSEGYQVESHEVITSDGYILNLHRIPHGRLGQRNGKVAFLQHGLLCSSADWVIAGPQNALAYILADQGYDVWMGNARGNTQSRRHISIDPRRSAFWQFSWHEIGVIDLPQMIDYVLEHTGVDSVYYAGHSQGTTVFYVMTSSLPEYNEKIKVHVSLAPVGFMNHMTSPLLRIISYWEKPLGTLLSLIGVNEFLPSNAFTQLLTDALCKADSVTQLLCTNALFAICGFSREQMNTTLLPLMMYYTPAGAATKQLLHYGQEIRSAKFREYDFGTIQNIRKYKSLSPPDYALKSVTAPVYMIYSLNDWLAAVKDVDRLCEGIGNCSGKLLVPHEKFNHLDYLYGIDAKELVYEKVVTLFGMH